MIVSSFIILRMDIIKFTVCLDFISAISLDIIELENKLNKAGISSAMPTAAKIGER